MRLDRLQDSSAMHEVGALVGSRHEMGERVFADNGAFGIAQELFEAALGFGNRVGVPANLGKKAAGVG